MKKIWFVWLMPLIVLTGCSERYRYPCQDPENWNEKQCQKPFCSANGTCPEDLTHYEKKSASGSQQPVAMNNNNNKGVCK
jgi:hypothetical protein